MKTDCIIWDGAVCGKYGWDRANSQGAHRTALESRLGRKIKPGLMALHHCDVKKCVNPDHLYEGDKSQNGRDAWNRNRNAWGNRSAGEDSPNAKLTWEEVKQIRSMYAEGTRQTTLAEQFDVSQARISKIVRGEGWREDSGN